jgi:hypothetical protein
MKQSKSKQLQKVIKASPNTVHHLTIEGLLEMTDAGGVSSIKENSNDRKSDSTIFAVHWTITQNCESKLKDFNLAELDNQETKANKSRTTHALVPTPR